MITQFILLSQVFWAMSLLRSCEATSTDSSMLRFDPPNVNVLEGNNVTLSCVVSVNHPGKYYIRWNNKSSSVFHPQPNCTVSGPLSNTQEYKVRCINKEVQITILLVSRERHGEVWTCQRNLLSEIYESSSTFSVNVPITNVRFEKRVEYTMTEENTQAKFVCVSSAGYPLATIRWYKSNTVLSNVDVLTSNTTSDKYLKVVRSTVSMFLTRADNSSQIHCAANNNGTTWLPSTNTTVIIYYAPDIPIITNGTNQVKGEFSVMEGNVLDVICTASSFPEPIYSWIRPTGPNIHGQQLNISHITLHERGIYTCKAHNTMELPSGQTYQGENTTSIFIKILCKPQAPTDFRYIKELTTDSSITLKWKPGYNGGFDQTFILKYRKTNVDTIWTTVELLHSREPVMTATLSSLTSDVVYEIALTAENQFGQSNSSISLYANTNPGSTQEESLSSSINNTPKMVGGLVGSAILIAGVCICVWILRRRYFSTSEETNQTYQVVSYPPPDATYDENYRVSNSEIGTAATDSRGSSATITASRYEDLEMSEVGNDTEKTISKP